MTDRPTLLEEALKSAAENERREFPDHGTNYFDVYQQIREQCVKELFPICEIKIAEEQASKENKFGAWYTKHGLMHALDVQIGISLLLDAPLRNFCNPYELFVLATACMLHDAGLYAGRDGHEKTAAEVAETFIEDAGLDRLTGRNIGEVVRGHTGTMESGDKDVIQKIAGEKDPKEKDPNFRGAMLSALLRLADELADNPKRAYKLVLEQPKNPAYLAHLFCKRVSIRALRDPARITYHVDVVPEDMMVKHQHPYKKLGKMVYFFDFVVERILKLDCEWRYCSQFLLPLLQKGGELVSGMPLQKLSITLDLNRFNMDSKIAEFPRTGYPPTEQAEALFGNDSGFPCAKDLHKIAKNHQRKA